jgi:hypothetical protein
VAAIQYTVTQNNTYNNTINLGREGAVPSLYELYPGICLTTEEKTHKNLSHGSCVRKSVEIL